MVREWLRLMANENVSPDQLDFHKTQVKLTALVERFRNSEDLFKSITPADVWEQAKIFLGKPAQFTFRALPDEMVAARTAQSTAAR